MWGKHHVYTRNKTPIPKYPTKSYTTWKETLLIHTYTLSPRIFVRLRYLFIPCRTYAYNIIHISSLSSSRFESPHLSHLVVLLTLCFLCHTAPHHTTPHQHLRIHPHLLTNAPPTRHLAESPSRKRRNVCTPQSNYQTHITSHRIRTYTYPSWQATLTNAQSNLIHLSHNQIHKLTQSYLRFTLPNSLLMIELRNLWSVIQSTTTTPPTTYLPTYIHSPKFPTSKSKCKKS